MQPDKQTKTKFPDPSREELLQYLERWINQCRELTNEADLQRKRAEQYKHRHRDAVAYGTVMTILNLGWVFLTLWELFRG